MIPPDWVLSLQASASTAYRLSISKDFTWQDTRELQDLAEAVEQEISIREHQSKHHQDFIKKIRSNT